MRSGGHTPLNEERIDNIVKSIIHADMASPMTQNVVETCDSVSELIAVVVCLRSRGYLVTSVDYDPRTQHQRLFLRNPYMEMVHNGHLEVSMCALKIDPKLTGILWQTVSQVEAIDDAIDDAIDEFHEYWNILGVHPDG